ncbi:CinA family nicotinamide mononucleotide deamidase-related protein [Archangium primigenium]|uniref:CinA family nicotinamide mononucleotide deamidase-related protein n=1 Tax=[Archangium] primigenium TaxID=2792470 RepID=UPI001956D433|nr:CinA family nicotinamide mononucleotide deamidase-related protein [Archangium primigenium]MBM7118533.1 CinA family nicotinamide mononucleotide deamidase-related protein [Archangium primigenium]
MRVELLCTGDELVTGLTPDTNSPFLEARLFELGIKVDRVVLVGDVREDITRGLEEAAARADVVIVSGGLGPTADDFTAECAAAAARVPLVEDAATREALAERARKRGRELTPNVARMALVPRGAEVVPNPVGAAPLFIVRLGDCQLFFLPGVPREYRALVDGEVLPRVRAELERRPGRVWRAFRLLRTVGLPESVLDARVAPLAVAHPRVVFGFRTHAPENQLKLMAEAPSQAEADAALAAAEAAARAELGPAVYGADQDTYAAVLARRLTDAGATLALAESCTGGLIASQLAAIPGASAFLVGSAVVYAERMKTAWAHVSPELLARHGAVSRPVAVAMAEGIRAACATTYGLSVTGVAGPTGGTPEEPVGSVYCALAVEGGPTRAERFSLSGDRELIRLFAASHALELLREHLLSSASRP